MMFHIDLANCVKCLGCMGVCPSSAIEFAQTGFIINSDCIDCGACRAACPIGAIKEGGFKEIEPSIYDETISTVEMSFDCAVIGGGPAGLSFAYHAAKCGFRVGIFDTKQQIGLPVACAEAISKTGLERVFQPKPEWIASRIEHVDVFAPSGRVLHVEHPDAGYVLNRPIFESDLAKSAEEFGAQLFLNTRVLHLVGKSEIDCMICEKDGEQITVRAQVFIGADGIGGLCARFISRQNFLTTDDFESCAQVLLETQKMPAPETVEFHWGSRLAPGGYAWVFPKSERTANVGLGIMPSSKGINAKKYLDTFIAKRFPDAKIIEARHGIVPCCTPIAQPYKANLLLIGDAARLVNPISGGGIDWAILSGKSAAEALLAAKSEASSVNIDLFHRSYMASLDNANVSILNIYARIKPAISSLPDEDIDTAAIFLEKKLCGKVWHGIDIPALVFDTVKNLPLLFPVARNLALSYFFPKKRSISPAAREFLEKKYGIK